jgi:hypothetical protein
MVKQSKQKKSPNGRNNQRASGVNNGKSIIAPTYRNPINPVVTRVTGTPYIKSGPNGNITVTNREILMTLSGTAATGIIPGGSALMQFKFSTSTVNTIDSTFWLNKIASAYDKWKIKNLTLSYQPSLAPGTTGGQIAYVWDSDPSRITAISTIPSMSGNMRAQMHHVVEPSMLKVLANQMDRLPQYETFPVSSGATNGVAVVGTVNVAWDPISLGNAIAAGPMTIGRVFMDYEIEFLNPSNGIA